MSVFKNQHDGNSHQGMLGEALIPEFNPYPWDLEFIYLIGKIRTTTESNDINFIPLEGSLCFNWKTPGWAKLIGSLRDRCLS